MNVEYIKILLNHTDDDTQKIQIHDTLTTEFIQYLRNYSHKQVESCFAPIKTRLTKDVLNDLYYNVECTCDRCGNSELTRLSKTATISYICLPKNKQVKGHSVPHYMCPTCKEEREIELRKQREDAEEAYKWQRYENTDAFMEMLLDIDSDFLSNTDWKTQKRILFHPNVDNDAIAECVRLLNYSDFLQTPYWKIVSKYKKSQNDFKCQLCNSGGTLNVHHKTYARHGYEHLTDVIKNDLICLCENCHKKFHDKVVD